MPLNVHAYIFKTSQDKCTRIQALSPLYLSLSHTHTYTLARTFSDHYAVTAYTVATD